MKNNVHISPTQIVTTRHSQGKKKDIYQMPAICQISGSFYTARIPSLKNKFLLPLMGFIVPEKEINTQKNICDI